MALFKLDVAGNIGSQDCVTIGLSFEDRQMKLVTLILLLPKVV